MLEVNDSPLYSASFFAEEDPWSYLEELRENNPISIHHRSDGYSFYALTKYSDVFDAYLKHKTLSSSYGTMIDGSYRPERDSASGKMLIVADEPEHKKIKKPVKVSGFNKEMIDKVALTVRANIRHSLSELSVGEELDFSTHVAPALPEGVLEVLFGIGPSDASSLLHATRTMIGYRDAVYASHAPLESLVDAQQDVLDFMVELLQERMASDDDQDLVGALAQMVKSGELDEDTAILNCLNVAVGGNETTPHTSSLSVLTASQFPGEWSRFVNGEVDSDTATEEFLRWTSTNSYVQRLALEDVEIGGVTIPEGSFVTLWNMSANRDIDVFDDPNTFDIGRDPNKQIAFGAGVHRCIGAPVASLEIKAFLEELRAWDKKFDVVGTPLRLYSNFMLGLTSLPVAVQAK